MPGVLASQQIKDLINSGIVRAETPVQDEQIQPASLDLRLGSIALRVRASFLAGAGTSISDRLAGFEMHRLDLSEGAVLEKGCVYIVPLVESVSLPLDMDAVANAKSSTGRLDLLTRAVTDGGTEFDHIPAGYRGKLYVEICPLSFSVVVHAGMTLNQIRFRRGRVKLNDEELLQLHKEESLVKTTPPTEPVILDGLGFSVDLKLSAANRPGRHTNPKKKKRHASPAQKDFFPGAEGPHIGYRARRHTDVLDLRKIGAHHPLDYWDKVYSIDGRIVLDPGAFYILMSREAVHIPPNFAAEMTPYTAAGEFRVHYAGFFDPGFGHGKGPASRGVLEVRCHDAPFVLEHGQVVGRLVYERMDQPPDKLYGKSSKSNYQGQKLKLSKHFMTID